MTRRLLLSLLPLCLSAALHAQKHINLSDCRTLGRVMADPQITGFLNKHVDCKEPVLMFTGVLPHAPQPSNTKCRSVEVGDNIFRIIDSTELQAGYYAPCRIVRILSIRNDKQGVEFSLDWMETSAVFEVSEELNKYAVRLVRVNQME